MLNNFSDNVSNSRAGRKRIYSDIPLNLTIHPNTKDLTVVKDIDAVKISVKNLVMTNFMERPFQPTLGSGVTGLLFENNDAFTKESIKDEIYRVLKEHESRANGVQVEVLDNSERNEYLINIKFNVIFSQIRQEIEFYLERIR
jgi:phage baseplate assembly protein W